MMRSATMIVACITFLGLGLVTAALGPALPDLAAQSSSSLTAVGSLFTVVFLGSLCAIAVAGALTDRFGPAPVLLVGAVLTGAGTLGYTLMDSLPAMLAMGFVTGIGHGAVDIGNNVMIARAFAGRSIAALNLLNVFFGVGAMAGPAVAGLTMKMGYTGISGLWLGAGLMLLVALLAPLLPSRAALRGHDTGRPATAGKPAGAALRSPLLWTFGFMLLLYVGIEQGIGGWTTAYLTQTTTLDTSYAALATSGFWLAITLGRMAAAALGTRLAPMRLLQISLATSVGAGALLLLSTGSAWLSVAAILLLGLSFAPVFPTTVGIATTAFPDAPGAAGSLTIAMGSLGGMLLPLLQGALMEGVGPRTSIGVIAAGTVVMLLLQRLATTQNRTAA